MREPQAHEVVAETVSWVRNFVVGHGLCPFAAAPLAAGQVRFAVSEAREPSQLLADLDIELDRLCACSPDVLDTTVLIHPWLLHGFPDYLEFVERATQHLEARQLTGVFQLASFHPDYCFADAPADDPANASNRSPYPMLHILREASVTRAVDCHPNPDTIWRRNVAHLRALAAGPK